MLGKIVTVTVDRPKGSFHPVYKDLYYPINYGYVEGVVGGDGEWQDAYVLGVGETVKTFTGKVIAVVHRLDDVEDKWVVAPADSEFTEDEIISSIIFQEKYFNFEIVM